MACRPEMKMNDFFGSMKQKGTVSQFSVHTRCVCRNDCYVCIPGEFFGIKLAGPMKNMNAVIMHRGLWRPAGVHLLGHTGSNAFGNVWDVSVLQWHPMTMKCCSSCINYTIFRFSMVYVFMATASFSV